MTTRKRSQGQRLLRLIRLLETDRLTSAQLAEQLDCTQQEVQRDLRLLRAESWDVGETEKRPKRYFLSPDATPLSDPVRSVITHALLRMLHHHAPTPSRLYHRAALDLVAQLPERPREVALQSLGAVSNDTSRILETVAAAWCWGQPLRFSYHKPNALQSKEAVGDVVFMEISRSNLDWYVFIRRRGEEVVKTFQLSRFTDATRLENETSPDIPFDPRAQLGGAWGIVGAGTGPLCIVTLRFLPEALPWVAYRPWPGQISAQRMADGHYLLQIAAPIQGQWPLELLAWIRSWGPRVDVLSPPNVREKWLAEASELLFRYGAPQQEDLP